MLQIPEVERQLGQPVLNVPASGSVAAAVEADRLELIGAEPFVEPLGGGRLGLEPLDLLVWREGGELGDVAFALAGRRRLDRAGDAPLDALAEALTARDDVADEVPEAPRGAVGGLLPGGRWQSAQQVGHAASGGLDVAEALVNVGTGGHA